MFFKQLTQSPHFQTRKTNPQFESIWDLHVLEIFVSLFWKSSDSSSCDLGFSIDHHIHQLGVAVQSEWVHKRKSWVSVLYISLETLFNEVCLWFHNNEGIHSTFLGHFSYEKALFFCCEGTFRKRNMAQFHFYELH